METLAKKQQNKIFKVTAAVEIQLIERLALQSISILLNLSIPLSESAISLKKNSVFLDIRMAESDKLNIDSVISRLLEGKKYFTEIRTPLTDSICATECCILSSTWI